MDKFRFKKKFGQNFITDKNILNKIIEKSQIEEKSLIIEIGCGSGNLTQKLLETNNYVLGYEIDLELKEELKQISTDKLKIIYGDFLKKNIKEDIKEYKYNKLYIISNLPYYITTPILNKIIEEKIDVETIVIMVQKEVAERFIAKPNTKQYNSLSIFLQYNFNIEKLFDVNRNVFIPKPNVDSIVLKLTKRNKEIVNEEKFFKLIRDSFKQKRKTLKNNLKEYDFNKIYKKLEEKNYKENVRAEQIDINTYIEIANII